MAENSIMEFAPVPDAAYKEFVSRFLEKYLSLGFAVLPKAEIDTLVFSLMVDLGFISPSIEEYEVARKLHITETKLSALRLSANARSKNPQTIEQSIAELKQRLENGSIKIFPKNENVLLSVPYPYLKKNLATAAERVTGFPSDNYLNAKKVEMPLSVFCAVLYENDGDMRKEFIKNIKKQAKDAQKIDAALSQKLKPQEIINTALSAAGVAFSLAQVLPLFGITFPQL